jgi:hypothetical protein
VAKKATAKPMMQPGPPLKKRLPPTTSLTGGMAPPAERDRTTPGAQPANPLPRSLPGGPLPAGRPQRVGHYILSATPEYPSGYEMLNDQPDLLAEVDKKFRQAYQLPPRLRPQSLQAPYIGTPTVMEKNRAKNISRGWRKPKSWQG